MRLVSIIIVTFNTGATVLRCLQRIQQTMQQFDSEIIVVDNASEDDTVELVRRHHPDVKIITMTKNLGFSSGNNTGCREAKGDYIALINPDLLVAEDAIPALVEYLERNRDVGIVGPRTFDETGRISLTARPAYSAMYVALDYLRVGKRFPNIGNGKEYQINLYASQPQDVHWLQGSCLVMRREVYERVGGFDQGFFLYVEDADLCQRVRESGLRIVYNPTTSVTHIGGTSTARHPYFRVRGYHISPLYYFRKHKKNLQVNVLKLVFTVELLPKSALRMIRNVYHYDAAQALQARAEIAVLLECWRY